MKKIAVFPPLLLSFFFYGTNYISRYWNYHTKQFFQSGPWAKCKAVGITQVNNNADECGIKPGPGDANL